MLFEFSFIGNNLIELVLIFGSSNHIEILNNDIFDWEGISNFEGNLRMKKNLKIRCFTNKFSS